MITTQDFLDVLPIVQGQGWHVTACGYIRNANNQCPLCALADEIAGRPLGIAVDPITSLAAVKLYDLDTTSYEAIAAIVYAADLPYEVHRTALTHALGMTP